MHSTTLAMPDGARTTRKLIYTCTMAGVNTHPPCQNPALTELDLSHTRLERSELLQPLMTAIAKSGSFCALRLAGMAPGFKAVRVCHPPVLHFGLHVRIKKGISSLVYLFYPWFFGHSTHLGM